MAKLNQGDVYTGPRAVCDDEEVGYVRAFYALTADGKQLLLQNGKPVRLTHVDLAPGDDEDGSEEFRVAGKGDPPFHSGRHVTLEPEPASAEGNVGA